VTIKHLNKIENKSENKMRDKKERKRMVQIEVNGEWLEQCDNCGNIWDGYAQCNCWQMDQGPADALEEEALEEEAVAGEESGYDTD
jgi:hypothetical protein